MRQHGKSTALAVHLGVQIQDHRVGRGGAQAAPGAHQAAQARKAEVTPRLIPQISKSGDVNVLPH
jgi:hypothetical protein